MWLNQRGSTAVEFAVAMPAVVLVLSLCVGAVVASSAFVRAQDAAGEVARLSARGDDPAVASVGGSFDIWDEGEFRCARVRLPISLLGFSVASGAEASSCALRDISG